MMGVSTNAILFYGYCWSEPVDLFGSEVEDGEWVDCVLKRRGVSNPWDSHPDTGGMTWDEQHRVSKKWCDDNETALTSWNEACNAVNQEFGVGVGYHGSGDWTVPFVAVIGPWTAARRGYPERIRSLEVNPEWDGKLRRFLEEFRIEPPGEIGWWLVSYWG